MNLDHLSDDPHLDAAKIALEQREVDDYVNYLTGLLEDDYCTFAADTLTGIREAIKERRVITFPQRVAVQNIKDAADRKRQDEGRKVDHARPYRRRYEGWERR